MSRITNQIANLNTVDDADSVSEKPNDAELKMFSNTTFFDLDIGRSTDIRTTVDELLMQQEKQIQYPYKQQPLDDDDGHSGPVAGPSYSQPGQQRAPWMPFDFSGFSLAEELPPASLSLYDVDPVFHQQNPQQHTQHAQHAEHAQPRLPSLLSQPQQPQHAAAAANNNYAYGHHPTRQTPVQRHELAEKYAPKTEAASKAPASALAAVSEDDEKRRRNTAASARFRVKKKQREQEMERNLRHLQKEISEQAERIKQLEMENTWLKSLVVEKNTARDSSFIGKLRSELLEQEK